MAADRSTIDSFAELFLEDAFAPAPATIQAVYDLFDPSAANVATMDKILSRVSANHRDVIPFLLMGTDARLRVLYDVVKVEDVLGPGRSTLANTYVGIEGDLNTLTHAPTFVAVPPAVCGRAPEVAAPTMAHLDAVLAGEANPAGYLHPAPAAVDADHTKVTTRFLQPTTWDVAALVLASPGMEPATAYQVLDGHLRALPDPDTHASTRAWLRACVCQSALNNAHSRVARAPPPVVRTDQGFEDQVCPMLRVQLPKHFDPATIAVTTQAPFTAAAASFTAAAQRRFQDISSI